MSDQNHKKRWCGKLPYPTQIAARKAMLNMAKKRDTKKSRRGGGFKKTTYRCRDCGNWHWGHSR